MAKLSSIKADPDKELKGVWIEYENTGIQVCIARLNNPNYEKKIRELTRPTPGRRTRKISDEDMSDITKKAFADTIILGWKNMDDDEGNPIVYSPEKAFEILQDPTLRDFYTWVMLMSNESELFRLASLEEDAGD